MIEFTTVVAVDDEHLSELELVWPTWKRFRPQLLDHPLLLICDGVHEKANWEARLGFVDHPDKKVVLWDRPANSQREKMLSSLVYAPAEHVRTPWYLKLDTDAVAIESAEWISDEWFRGLTSPVFISSSWGYSKPANIVTQLDDWADTVPGLCQFPRLNLVATPGANSIHHPRIISWFFLASTAWTREVIKYSPAQLPVPSQDTFLWYCAARRGDYFIRQKLHRLGWRHVAGKRRLRQTCHEALQADNSSRPEAVDSNAPNVISSANATSKSAVRMIDEGPPGKKVECELQVLVLRPSECCLSQFTYPFVEQYCRQHGYSLAALELPRERPQLMARIQLLLHELFDVPRVLVLGSQMAPLPYAPPFHEATPEHDWGVPHDWQGSSSGGAPLSSPLSVLSSHRRNRELLSQVRTEAAVQQSESQGNEAPFRLDRRWAWNITRRFKPHQHSHLMWFARASGPLTEQRATVELLREYWFGQPSRARSSAHVLCAHLDGLNVSALSGAVVGVEQGELSSALLGWFPRMTLHMIAARTKDAPELTSRLSSDLVNATSLHETFENVHAAAWNTQFASARRHMHAGDLGAEGVGFADCSLDFVFLTYGASPSAFRKELETYYPKVRNGGLFAGSEYGRRRFPTVKEAVDHFVAKHGLQLSVQAGMWSVRVNSGTFGTAVSTVCRQVGSVPPSPPPALNGQIEAGYRNALVTDAKRGIILYNQGAKCLVRMLVCLHSLRKWWSGGITVFLEGPHPPQFISMLKQWHVRIVETSNPASGPYIRKVEVCLESPYERTLWLDSDTIVCGPIDEIMDELDNYEVVTPHFAGWWADGRTIRRRIRGYEGKCPQDWIEQAIGRYPAVNMGVFAVRRGASFLQPWLELSRKGDHKVVRLPEEIAFQILYPRYPVGIISPKFGASVKHDPGTSDIRIVHYHGQKHVHPFELCQHWKQHFHELLDLGNSQLPSMLSYADRRLKKYLATIRLSAESDQQAPKSPASSMQTGRWNKGKTPLVTTEERHHG